MRRIRAGLHRAAVHPVGGAPAPHQDGGEPLPTVVIAPLNKTAHPDNPGWAVLLYEALSQDAPGYKLEHGYVLEQTRGYIGSPVPTKPAECIHHTKSATAM